MPKLIEWYLDTNPETPESNIFSNDNKLIATVFEESDTATDRAKILASAPLLYNTMVEIVNLWESYKAQQESINSEAILVEPDWVTKAKAALATIGDLNSSLYQ
jgi:hypothetical protein